MQTLRFGKFTSHHISSRGFAKASKNLPRNWTTSGRHKSPGTPQSAQLDPIVRIESNERLSEITIYNGTVYLSGQVCDDPDAPFSEQTRSMLRSVDELLVTAGSSRRSILSATIYMKDINNFDAMNDIWDNWIPGWHTPARAVVQGLLPRNVEMEISIVAAQIK